MKTIAAYIRRAEPGEPTLAAPEEQEREIRQYAITRYGDGKYKMELFRELTPFNRVDGRPALHRMLEWLGAHSVAAVLVHRASCLFRTMEDGVVVGDFLRSHGVELVSVVEGEIDLATVEKRLFGNVERLIEQHYAKREKKKR
ncbi:MAG TPA: recombinase family protein [Spirochaetota bacterium]|nr:recombinase family protein [Spirochaetota bacterium]HNT11215.1 recombinase family protein [Spirochaetota bacterium]HNV46466.1 recombinase family protein [Spirochaetota bacterium]HPU88123.1 recombinase family protein [Spirochaetota bacterium]